MPPASNPHLGPVDPDKAPFIELLREGRAFPTVLVLLSAMSQALQVLVIAIIMPTVVADLGGAAYFTWPAMLYTIAGIVGAVCLAPFWAVLGARNGYAVSGIVFLLGTIGCALAPTMAALVAARTVQGLAGGLIMAGSVAVISTMFDGRHRTRLLAIQQGTWTTSHLLGPLVGGLFVQIEWWRGSFWVMLPFIIGFTLISWLKVPERLTDGERRPLGAVIASGGIPLTRIGVLTAGVVCLALAGPVDDALARASLVTAAIVILWLAFRMDQNSTTRLFPAHALNPRSVVGLALWVLMLGGAVQNAVTLFLPLLLQVVHGVTPLFINFVTITISLGWTVGAFSVSGLSGNRERFALWFGPILMLIGLAIITITAQLPLLAVLTAGAFIMGMGVGTHNVPLIARTLAHSPLGEEKVIAGALPTVRSLGTAFGAASAGLLANIAGLTDVTDAGVVGPAITVIYGVHVLPFVVVVIFMVRFARLAIPREARGPRLSPGSAE